jgi:hypothetical protein
MVYALDSAAFTKKIRQRLGGDDKKVKALIEGLPSFSTAHEAWYSESLALLRQLLPDRVGNTPAVSHMAHGTMGYGMIRMLFGFAGPRGL